MKCIQHEQHGHVMVLKIEGDIEFDDSVDLLNTFHEISNKSSKHVVIDLKKCQYIDSGGLGAIARGMNQTNTFHSQFALCNLSDECREIVAMTMLDRYLKIYNSLEESLEYLSLV